MDNQRTIIGAGLVTGAVLVTKSYVAGGDIKRPLLGIFIATVLLAGMDASGLGAIAGPMAILLAGTVSILYAIPLLEKAQEQL